LVYAFDVWDQVHLADPAAEAGNAATGLQLVTEKGESLSGYPLFERVVRSLRLLWPVALFTWVPGVAAAARSRFPGDDPVALAALGVNGEGSHVSTTREQVR